MALAYRLCVVSSFAIGGSLAQTPINLTPWTAESYAAVSSFPAGVWSVAPGGLTVVQSQNGQPTVFHSDFNLYNLRIEGQVSVSASDDDFIGFALGYQPGDVGNPNADYLLLDWKRATQNFNFGAPSCTPGSASLEGLAISRVQGVPTADELWGHVDLNTAPCSTPNDRVTELQRGATLGSTGWQAGQVYTFAIDYTPNRVVVHVNGVQQIDLTGTFGNGRVAFYNFSQAGVTYSAFTSTCIASWSNYGVGFAGATGVPSLTASAAPVLGSTVLLQMRSAAAAPSLATLALAWQPLNFVTSFGGTLLVDPVVFVGLVLPASPAQSVVPFAVPNQASLCGDLVYAQFANLDPGASQGIAFSRGLALALGL
jgi:hypothetical protein